MNCNWLISLRFHIEGTSRRSTVTEPSLGNLQDSSLVQFTCVYLYIYVWSSSLLPGFFPLFFFHGIRNFKIPSGNGPCWLKTNLINLSLHLSKFHLNEIQEKTERAPQYLYYTFCSRSSQQLNRGLRFCNHFSHLHLLNFTKTKRKKTKQQLWE